MKAQLILFGGRSEIPNMLTILYYNPDVLAVLSSNESFPSVAKFEKVVKKYLPDCRFEALEPVDAFEPEEIEKRFEESFKEYPNAQWICNITAATTIMSLSIYEKARKLSIPALYINTSKSRIINFWGEKYNDNIFHLTVQQYMECYYRSLEPGDRENGRSLSENEWLPFAQLLGKNPDLIPILKKVLKGFEAGKAGASKKCLPKENSPNAHYILQEAQKCGLVNDLVSNAQAFEFRLNDLQHSFLNGVWLEAYVWSQVKDNTLFDDCIWNRKIIVDKVVRQLDVAMTYKAQLVIAECKTGDDATSGTLNAFQTLVRSVGDRFVGKVLVFSHLPPSQADDREKYKEHQNFIAKAQKNHIVVVMADQLPEVGALLVKEAVSPKYPRM